MKRRILQFARLGAGLAAGAIFGAAPTFAADEATPSQAPSAVQAQPQDGGGRGNRGDRGNRGNPGADNAPDRRGNFNPAGGRGGFGGLNLDEKQNELLREAMQVESDELRKLSEKLQAAQKELVKAVVAEKYDEAAVRQKADAVSRIQTDITVLRAKAFATVSPTLKPEQRDQIENNRLASSIITGAGVAFGGQAGFGGSPDQNFRRGDRGNNAPGGEPNQFRRRGGDRPGQ